MCLHQHSDTMWAMKNLRLPGRRWMAVFFAAYLAVFMFCWSFWIDNDRFDAAVVGAVVGGAVAGALYFWFMSIASG